MALRLYKIKDWSAHFETHESRKLKRLDWVAMPNKHDGLGFRLVAAEKDAPALLAAWTLIVQIASRSDSGARGTLARDGRPITSHELSLMTGFPAKIFDRAFQFFTQDRVGWLVAEQWQTDLPGLADDPAESAGAPGFAAARTPIQDRTGQDRTKQDTPKRASEAAPAIADLPPVLQTSEFQTAWSAWLKHRTEIKAPLKPTSASQTLSSLALIGPQRAIAMIRFTIFKGWRGLREPSAEDLKQFQARQGAERPALTEPTGWKQFLNHEFPDSVYSANGTSEAHKWADLSRDVQQWLIGEMRKKGEL